MFQSTPPRGGRPCWPRYPCKAVYVSIHAPARGATQVRVPSHSSNPVSIHAPARGATTDSPRSKGVLDVSIHAPARGATKQIRHQAVASLCFNPRPRAGGDFLAQRVETRPTGFQSTPPRGGRPKTYTSLVHIITFQSTPPRGGRRLNYLADSPHEKFQSTPPRGGRPGCDAHGLGG